MNGIATAIGYVRVSTQEQAASGASLESQRHSIVAECERRGWDLAGIAADEGASASTVRKRPGLAAAVEACEAGRAQVLVVAKVDRLSRSVIDFAGLMERARKRGWQIAVLDLGVDTTTPNGELIAGILAQVAQWERRLIAQRTKEALAVKRSQGVRIGRRSTLPKEVAVRIVEARDRGATLARIADALNDDAVPTGQGGQRWHASTVRAILSQFG